MPIRKRMLGLFVSIVVLCAMSMTALAHDVPDTSKKGSVHITMRLGENAVPGGSITLYRVGAVAEDDGNYSFVLTGEFADCGISLDDIQSARLAKDLAAHAKGHALVGATQKIDGNGSVSFRDLEPGLYLFVQSKAPEGYHKADPFLVSVPMMEDGSYVYDVDASPKVELEKKSDEPEIPETPVNPETPTTPTTPKTPVTGAVLPGGPEPSVSQPIPTVPVLPQTGQLNWPIPVLVVLGLCLFSIGWVLRTGKKKDGYEK